MNRKLLILTTIILALVSCEKEFDDISDINQPILFQVEHLNFAWGYSHLGLLITQKGEIKSFETPKIWHRPDSLGYITENELVENLTQANTELDNIDSKTLLKYINKIQDVDPESMSEPEGKTHDYGVTKYSGYVYDDQKGKYKEIVLELYGDWSSINTTREAKQIAKWLKKYFDEMK